MGPPEDSVSIVRPGDLQTAPATPGVDRHVAFDTENNTVVRARVEGGTATDWHHHCDRHVYAYLLEGEAVIEYGDGGGGRREFSAGDFAYIPPWTVHRDVNPGEETQVVLLNFVGTGPLVEHVQAPTSG